MLPVGAACWIRRQYHFPGLLCKQPCQRNLAWWSLLLLVSLNVPGTYNRYKDHVWNFNTFI
jgi:hypothetical protein